MFRYYCYILYQEALRPDSYRKLLENLDSHFQINTHSPLKLSTGFAIAVFTDW